MMSRRILAAPLSALALAAVASAAVPVPSLTGPITEPGVILVSSTGFDLAPLGYSEQEFFLSGTATAWGSAEALASDGRWSVVPGATAEYRTRIVVRRPANPKRFNGTVLVEWHNVSGGIEAAPDWTFTHTLLMRAGFAWVGVSAQAVGIHGGSSPFGLNLSLQALDPARYGSLLHPGDSFSYDMFSQVAALVRDRGGASPLGDLRVRRVIAIGESQSASRLVTYVNAVHPLAQVYDGFLIHSRGGGAAALSQSPEPAVRAPTPTFIRDDLDVPVLTLETETDLPGLGFLAARQPDTRRLRLWEVAGTAHGDLYLLLVGPADRGPAAIDTAYHPPTLEPITGFVSCAQPVNAGPQHFVLAAAVVGLERWVRTGRPPRPMPRLETDEEGTFVLDQHGNVRGGIRTPQLDVPIATLSGLGQSGSAFCGLFGTTTPLDAATLATLYPTHRGYVRAVRRAARSAVRRRVLLRPDARAIVAAAVASDVGR
jgi:hypothetical protein